MLTPAELAEILDRIDWGLDHWRDRAKLREHLAAQVAEIASLKRDLDAHDAALQQHDGNGWHTLKVRRVPVLGTVTGADAKVVFYEAVEE